eukprot:15455695-Alexandrium_andersonii.AAC.1
MPAIGLQGGAAATAPCSERTASSTVSMGTWLVATTARGRGRLVGQDTLLRHNDACVSARRMVRQWCRWGT